MKALLDIHKNPLNIQPKMVKDLQDTQKPGLVWISIPNQNVMDVSIMSLVSIKMTHFYG